jgi:hypothetical protein
VSPSSGPAGGRGPPIAAEERENLPSRAAHRRRGGQELGAHRGGAQRLDGGLVQAHHRAERARDEVKLVLHDELGRAQPLGQHLRARAGTGPSGVPKNCRPSRECARPKSMPASARHGTIANLSTVATRNDGSSRYTCSSTNTSGQALVGVGLVALAEVTPAEVFAQHPDVGRLALRSGCRVTVSGSRSKPHQGQCFRGSGDGAVLLSRWRSSTP